MSNNVNIAVQVLPIVPSEQIFGIVDKAIDVIRKSGIKYQVCPFETVLEGPYDTIMQIVRDLQKACYDAGCEEIIINLKMHLSKKKDVRIEDKTWKYE